MPETSPDAPTPTAESVIIRVSLTAFLSVMGRRKGGLFLKEISRLLAEEEAITQLLPRTGNPRRADAIRARREAMAIFQGYLPIRLTCLMEKD